MAQHVHVHLHRTADAGTSEGARKAAQTRKSQGGGIIGGNRSDNTGGAGHYHVNAYNPQGHAEVYPTDATSHGHAKQLAAKNLPGYRIAGTQRVGDAEGIKTKKSSGGVTTWGGADPKKIVPKARVFGHDAGTSEGAKKAAQTRKSGGSGPNKAALEAAAAERNRINTQKYGGHRAAEAPGGSNLNQGLKYGPGINPNTPLRTARDAGTSEGARKAAATRKSHGGGAGPKPFDIVGYMSQGYNPTGIGPSHVGGFNASKHQNMAEAHYAHAKSHGNIGGNRTNSAHYGASKLHSEAARLHTQAANTSRPEHVQAAQAATKKANAASKRLGHEIYGTA